MKLLVGLLLCVACVPLQPVAGGQPGGGEAPPPAAAASAGLACMPLVGCLAGCGQDAACLEDCMARGDDASRAAVNAVVACNGASEDATCEAELAACRDQGQGQVVAQQPGPEATPAPQGASEEMLPGQPHTTANLLPWMTGNWEGNNYHYTFYDDGRVLRASGVPLYTEKTGRYACASIVNETGTVTQEGDLLIMRFAAAEENHCGDKASAPALTVRYRIVWYQYNGPVELKLVDIDCTRGLMYCSDPMTRR